MPNKESGKAMETYVPSSQLGGDVFKNTLILSENPVRIWYEADVGMFRAK